VAREYRSRVHGSSDSTRRISDRPARWAARRPIAPAVLAGLGLRLLSVALGVGWFALDDYVYAIDPAWQWLANPEAAFPSDVRTVVLARAVWLCMITARRLGAEDPASLLRAAYLALGFWSLLAIPAVYSLAKTRLGEDAARSAAWLTAAQALMPLVSTRALIEVVCIPPLVWGLVLADRTLRGPAWRRVAVSAAGALLIGVASIVRFQVGLIAVVVAAWLFWQSVRERGAPLSTRLAPVAGLLLGGALAATMAGAIDLALGRPFLGTVIAYVDFNVHNAAQFGTSAWYTYLLQLLLYTAPPASLLLARPLWQACKRHTLVVLAVVVFVAVHSVVGHKEDRFLFPILPLLFVLLGAALADLAGGSRWARASFRWFWAVNAVALFVAIASDAQQNLTRPLLEIGRRGDIAEVAVVGLRNVPRFYVGAGPRVIEARRLDDLMARIDAGHRPDAILFRPAPRPELLERLRRRGPSAARCAPAGDFVDRLLVRLNPRRNKRRQPTGLVECEPR
jgi:hypothetical protein